MKRTHCRLDLEHLPDRITPSLSPTVMVNDGSAQRSCIGSATVFFDGPVALPQDPAAAFRLTGPGGVAVPLAASAASVAGGTVVTVGPTSGSLADGDYTLTVLSGQVRDAAGQPMAADVTFNFHRLFGDADGDRDVDATDFDMLRPDLGAPVGSPVGDWRLDSNGDGLVDNADLFQLRQHLGTTLPTATQTVAAAGPSVDTVMVNDGSAQRSCIGSATVFFSDTVTLPKDPAAAFRLTGPDGAAVPLAASTAAVAGGTVVTVGPTSGSLADGDYTLTVLAGQVLDATGAPMAADVTFNFHRLFGDADGDRDVDATDFDMLRPDLGAPVGSPVGDWRLDSNGDGLVDNADLFQLRQHMGTSLARRISA